MPPIRLVTVYCSSSNDLHPAHVDTARRLGVLIAASGRSLVYGGGRVGLMGEIARACRDAGGRSIGVITEHLKAAEQMDPENHENIVVKTMRERKALLEARGEAFVVLPGGLGTLEEFFEILVGRLLGEHDKPIIIVNTPDPDAASQSGLPAPGFYDPLLHMLEQLIRSRFAKPGVRQLFELARTPEETMLALDRAASAAPLSPQVRRHLVPSARSEA